MSWSEIALICTAAVLLVVVVSFVLYAKKHKDGKEHTDKVDVIDGVRYTKNAQVLDEGGRPMVSLKQGDILLERGKIYTVGKGNLFAGKYTALSGEENCLSFNLRLGGLVKEYKHGSIVVLSEGDKISAVSCNVVLR